MSYDVAIWAASSNQASKDPGQLRRGYSSLGKIYCLNTIISYLRCNLIYKALGIKAKRGWTAKAGQNSSYVGSIDARERQTSANVC